MPVSLNPATTEFARIAAVPSRNRTPTSLSSPRLPDAVPAGAPRMVALKIVGAERALEAVERLVDVGLGQRRHLGRDWMQLEEGFRFWIRVRFHEPVRSSSSRQAEEPSE